MEDAIRTTEDMASAEASADASTVAPVAAVPEDPTELRLQLHRHGYRPIPVLGAHVAMKGAGKRPMMKGWETVCASADEAEIARWTKAQRNCTNTGPALRRARRRRHRRARPRPCPPADLHRDRDARHVACLPDRARAEDPARVPHRCAVRQGPDQRVPHARRHGGAGRGAGDRAAVRGLRHPPRHEGALSLAGMLAARRAAARAAGVSRDGCAAFIAAAEEYLRKVGGQTTADRREIDREGRKAAGLKQKEAPSRELIEEAVAHIRNDELPYDDWIKVGLALYAALGPEGRDLWETWSARGVEERSRLHRREMGQLRQRAQRHRRHAVLARAAERLAGGTGAAGANARSARHARRRRMTTMHDGDGRPVIRIFAGFLHRDRRHGRGRADAGRARLLPARQHGGAPGHGAGRDLGWAHRSTRRASWTSRRTTWPKPSPGPPTGSGSTSARANGSAPTARTGSRRPSSAAKASGACRC